MAGEKRDIIDLSCDEGAPSPKRTKGVVGSSSKSSGILLVVQFDGELKEIVVDHPSLYSVTGFQSERDLSFFTNEMYRDITGECEAEPTSDEKLMAIYELATGDEAESGINYRAVVTFTYPL